MAPSRVARDVHLCVSPVNGKAPADVANVTIVEVNYDGVFPNMGFDGKEDPPWQIVPAGGEALVKVSVTPWEIEGYIGFSSDNPSAADVAKDIPGLIRLTGVAKDHTAVWAAAHVYGYLPVFIAPLNVCVKDEKIVVVDFHYISDNAGHHTDRNPNDVDAVMEELTEIWTSQANVVFVQAIVDSPTVEMNLGPVIDSGQEWNAVVEKRIGDPPDVYFFEGIDMPGAGGDEAGAYLGGDAVVEDWPDLNCWYEIIAHELGHHLGLGHSDEDGRNNGPDELMWGLHPPGARMIRHYQADLANDE